MGNPNVGKSVFFSRLTGTQVIASNYPGTTVEYIKGYLYFMGEKFEVIDVPGTYTLNPTCRAEEVACEMLKSTTKEQLKDASLIINVIDSTNLERNLSLTLELMEQSLPVIVALNLWDETKHLGIHIDTEKLEKWLGVPVVTTTAVTGEGFRKLLTRLKHARTPQVRKHSTQDRWKDIGVLINDIQHIEHRHHTWLDVLQDLTIRPIFGLPFAAVIASLAFMVIRFIGENLITYVGDPIFDNLWFPILTKLSVLMGGGGIWHNLLVGKLINGKIDFLQSFGALSTAFYVEFVMVLPYLIAFYFVLGILEDSGYLPRLAVLLDNVMHRVGLHGFAIVPTLLAFGCNIPGILSTRVLESKRERFIASTLISIGVPCAALQAMIIGILGKYGYLPIIIVYLTLACAWLILGILLNLMTPGFSPEIFLEIPPYRFPPILALFKKMYWRLRDFIIDAMPIVIGGVAVINLFYFFNLFDFIINACAPVVTGLLGLPKEAVVAVVVGFLRKDVAVGMLVPLGLTVKQLVVSSVVLSMFFPCIATFAIFLKELGWKDLAKATAIMIFASLLAGSILNRIL
jgi:ferrous iron transport protein B